MGYYGGAGARKVATIGPLGVAAAGAAAVPDRHDDGPRRLRQLGRVRVVDTCPPTPSRGSTSPRLVRTDTGGDSHILFVVRDDEGALRPALPDLGHDLAGLQPLRRQQPLHGRAGTAAPTRSATTGRLRREVRRAPRFVFNAEYPMVRWLERNGYDVSYFAGIDTDAAARSSWSTRPSSPWATTSTGRRAQRANVEAARDAGMQPRLLQRQRGLLEDALGEQHRRYGYALPDAGLLQGDARQREDRSHPTWTGTWRDPRFSPPADGGTAGERADRARCSRSTPTATIRCTVPADYGRFGSGGTPPWPRCCPGRWRRSPNGTLGHEWDEDVDNGFRPAGLIRLSETTIDVDELPASTTATPTRRARRRTR